MGALSKKILVYLLSFGIVFSWLPRPSSSREALPPGRSSADEAAGIEIAGDTSAVSAAAGWTLAFAASDTTEYDFPEEEGANKRLIRDITVWVIVSAFVAFFVIEVFIKGDTDEPPPPKDGKEFPPTTSK